MMKNWIIYFLLTLKSLSVEAQTLAGSPLILGYGENYVVRFKVDSFLITDRVFCHDALDFRAPKGFRSKYADFYMVKIDSLIFKLDSYVFKGEKPLGQMMIAVNPKMYFLEAGKTYYGIMGNGLCSGRYMTAFRILETPFSFELGSELSYKLTYGNGICCKMERNRWGKPLKVVKPIICDWRLLLSSKNLGIQKKRLKSKTK